MLVVSSESKVTLPKRPAVFCRYWDQQKVVMRLTETIFVEDEFAKLCIGRWVNPLWVIDYPQGVGIVTDAIVDLVEKIYYLPE